jgi:uncharacterized membrane protein (UPF0127 family)
VTGPLLRTREQFALVADAPFEITWPLFGAEKERLWAPGWDPVFVWPEKAEDQEGMIFKIRHEDQTAIWVNTAFDPTTRRIQYVYVIPDVLVTVITLKVTPIGRATSVEVVYERTALEVAANGIVKDMAANDRVAGEEWSQQINAHLRRQR